MRHLPPPPQQAPYLQQQQQQQQAQQQQPPQPQQQPNPAAGPYAQPRSPKQPAPSMLRSAASMPAAMTRQASFGSIVPKAEPPDHFGQSSGAAQPTAVPVQAPGLRSHASMPPITQPAIRAQVKPTAKRRRNGARHCDHGSASPFAACMHQKPQLLLTGRSGMARCLSAARKLAGVGDCSNYDDEGIICCTTMQD